MQFSRVETESEIIYGTIDIHSKKELLPDQFTLEFWIKCKFAPYNTEEKEIFGIYMYENEFDLKPYIKIYVDPLKNNNYIFQINDKNVGIPKHKIDNKWNHIAFVYDKLNNTSCIWYLNGRQILASNIDSPTMTEFIDKNFCKFLWTSYKESDYVWLHNINITYNSTDTDWDGIRYSQPFDHETLCFTDKRFGLNLENDESIDPIIKPIMAHNKTGIENLIYLPMQNNIAEDFGSIRPKWNIYNDNITVPLDIDGNNMYYYNYDTLYDLGNCLLLDNDTPIMENINNINLSVYDKGFTIDYFVFITPKLYGINKQLCENAQSFILNPGYFSNFPIIYNYGNNIDRYESQFSYLIGKNIYSPLMYDHIILNNNSYNWIKSYQGSNNKICNQSVYHVAKIFKPGVNYGIRTFINGCLFSNTNLSLSGNNKHSIHSLQNNQMDSNNWISNVNSNINSINNLNYSNAKQVKFTFYKNTEQSIGISHFRITPECLWWDESFDPISDKRLFILPTDNNRNAETQKISNITENNIALSYPIKNPNTKYDREYSINVNVGKGYYKEKSNFHPEYNSTYVDKFRYVTSILNQGKCRPKLYQNYPAVTTNTYKERKNIIKFKNHHIEDKPWYIKFWVYLKSNIKTFDHIELFALSGYEYNGGFCILTSGLGNIIIKKTNNKTPWSTNYRTITQYGTTEYNTRNKFNLDDWNFMLISSDKNSVYIYLNGTCIYIFDNYLLSYLHRLFFYLGAKDAPIVPYFTGIKVIVNSDKYNGSEIANWQLL